MYVSTLQNQITEGHAELKRGISGDWRTSILRYSVVFDYFYSLVELRLPSNSSNAVTSPPLDRESDTTNRTRDIQNSLFKGKGKVEVKRWDLRTVKVMYCSRSKDRVGLGGKGLT